MVIWLCLRWWYGAGWQWAFNRAVTVRLRWVSDNFSMMGLLRTWFSPFKQTFNGNVRGSFDIKMQAFFDGVISRFIGALARTALLFAGLVTMVFVLVTGIMFMIIWPLVPAALPTALALIITGVGR